MIEEINNNANNIEYWKKEYLELSKENEELSKFKNAWEELFKLSQNDDGNEKSAHDFLWFLEQTMQELEQKHGIEVE